MTSLDEQKRNFEVKGPLKKIKLKDVHAFKSDDEAFGQYKRLRDIKGDSGISCYKVIRRDGGFSVGFIGINKSKEAFGDDVLAHVCIEFVYLRPAFRGGKLSTLLMDVFFADVSRWLARIHEGVSATATLTVHSSSSSISNGGRRFVLVTNEVMKRYCKYMGFKFKFSER